MNTPITEKQKEIILRALEREKEYLREMVADLEEMYPNAYAASKESLNQAVADVIDTAWDVKFHLRATK